jgi:hypothetical protein
MASAEMTRSFRLEGPDGLGKKPLPELIGPVLTSLHDTLQDSVRMRFLHSSRAPGRLRRELKDAAAVRFLGHDGVGTSVTVLYFEVPRLGETAADFFSQQKFWEDDEQPNPEHTSFDLFSAALQDVAARKVDSAKYDVPFLQTIARYKTTLKHGLDRISVDGVSHESVSIDKQVVTAASELAAVTPPERRVRITGRLDVMAASQGLLKLRIRPGESVTALWNESQPIEVHRELFNRDVVVEGIAVFRPSGRILRIDAKAVAPAAVQDDFFRQLPQSNMIRDYDRMARTPLAEKKSPFARLLGALPSDESDEEYQAAIESLR